CYNTARWLQERLGGHVGSKGGHYFWVAPGMDHALDLTADQFGGSPILYKSTHHPLFQGMNAPVENIDDETTQRMISRANREFDGLGTIASKLALDYGGDSHPASEPQAQSDVEQRYWHHDPGY